MAHISRWGVDFEVAEKFGLMPMLKFARLAKAGVDSDDMEGLVVIGDVLRECFTDEAYAQFEDAAMKNHADGDELMEVMQQAMQAIAERPTQQPSDSSDGQPTITTSSVGDSSSQALSLLDGRPDLQLMVMQASEARAS
jgi:hypothetical protein